MGEICSLKMKSYKAENQYCCIIVNVGEINLIKITVCFQCLCRHAAE